MITGIASADQDSERQSDDDCSDWFHHPVHNQLGRFDTRSSIAASEPSLSPGSQTVTKAATIVSLQQPVSQWLEYADQSRLQ